MKGEGYRAYHPRLPRIYINGGKRGYLAGMSPAALVELLGPTPVSVAIDKT